MTAAILCACSSSDSQPSASSNPALTAQPTAGNAAQPTRFIANNIDDAIRLSKTIFNRQGSTLAVAHVDSATYVETTVEQARAFFAPQYPGDWGVPDSDRVWVIVGYGQFESTAIGITDPSPAVESAAWAVVVEGAGLSELAYSNQRYDLSPLGTPGDLDPADLNSPD
ncbi:MAG TPA: hypothetical protein VIP09_11990 [Dehalococcoidia bacterium]|jgi:hypothetical protein